MEAMPYAVASILASNAGASSCSLLNWHFELRAERELSKGLFVPECFIVINQNQHLSYLQLRPRMFGKDDVDKAEFFNEIKDICKCWLTPGKLSVNKAPGGCASTRNDEHGEVNLGSQVW
jgi:hypothetical protein